jgi:hypothetical protein
VKDFVQRHPVFTVVIVLALLLILWLLGVPAVVAYFASYHQFFHVLISEGGLNIWLARAIGIALAGAVFFGTKWAFSLNPRKRTRGDFLILGSFLAFNLLMYACTRSTDALEAEGRLITQTGDPAKWFYIADDGTWRLFSHPGYAPTGEQLQEMTPEAAREYGAWMRDKEARDLRKAAERAAESETQSTADAERRFRETYLNDGVVIGQENKIMLAFRSDPPNSEADTLEAQFAKLLASERRQSLSGLFKPAFYTGALFDDLWNGDTSIVDRLKLLPQPSSSLVLGKSNFSLPAKADLDGIISVRGTLSLVVIRKDGRSGPWEFHASGAGGDAREANANCAKRLLEAIDLRVVLP